MRSTCCGWTVSTCGNGPLSERKTLLRKLLPRKPRSLVYVQHFASGTDLFRVICERDMEGVVAKQASARYAPEATTWVKIKNTHFSITTIRPSDLLVRRRASPRVWLVRELP